MAGGRRAVAVVGGGLAGLSAAWDLCTLPDAAPCDVHLFEGRRVLGGRATSRYFFDEKLLLDNAQHVAMNACVEFLDFLRKTDLLRFWKCQPEMTFVARDLRRGHGAPPRFYPFRDGKFGLSPSLWGLRFLTPMERLRVACLLGKALGEKNAHGWNFEEWLARNACSSRLSRLFFDPVLLSAFSDRASSISFRLAQGVLRRMFAGERGAWHLWIPQRPLSEIFDRELGAKLATLENLHVHRGLKVQRVCPTQDAGGLHLEGVHFQKRNHFRLPFDAVILAVPWDVAGRILPQLVTRNVLRPQIFEPRCISAVHVWTAEPMFAQPNLVTAGETVQWLFRPPFAPSPLGHYHQALISDSDGTCSARLETLAGVVNHELLELFPGVEIRRMHATRTPHAVFAPTTAVEHERPTFATPFPNVFLAGDWTATDLPATMEGAVTSGRRAAREVLETLCVGSPPSELRPPPRA